MYVCVFRKTREYRPRTSTLAGYLSFPARAEHAAIYIYVCVCMCGVVCCASRPLTPTRYISLFSRHWRALVALLLADEPRHPHGSRSSTLCWCSVKCPCSSSPSPPPPSSSRRGFPLPKPAPTSADQSRAVTHTPLGVWRVRRTRAVLLPATASARRMNAVRRRRRRRRRDGDDTTAMAMMRRLRRRQRGASTRWPALVPSLS